MDSEAIKAMVETRAAQAIGEANAARDEAPDVIDESEYYDAGRVVH